MLPSREPSGSYVLSPVPVWVHSEGMQDLQRQIQGSSAISLVSEARFLVMINKWCVLWYHIQCSVLWQDCTWSPSTQTIPVHPRLFMYFLTCAWAGVAYCSMDSSKYFSELETVPGPVLLQHVQVCWSHTQQHHAAGSSGRLQYPLATILPVVLLFPVSTFATHILGQVPTTPCFIIEAEQSKQQPSVWIQSIDVAPWPGSGAQEYCHGCHHVGTGKVNVHCVEEHGQN